MAYRINISDRFWNKVDIKGPDECWNWMGAKYPSGYGEFYYQCNDRTKSHRMAWILTNGDIPYGYLVLHKCDNRSCCNPRHLYIGTHADNMRDKQLRYSGPYIGGRDRSVNSEDICRMHTMHKEGFTQSEIASVFNLSRGHISKLLKIEVGLDSVV